MMIKEVPKDDKKTQMNNYKQLIPAIILIHNVTDPKSITDPLNDRLYNKLHKFETI